MNPALAFLVGAVAIWLVANGKAADIWKAAFGTSSKTQRPADPSTNQPGGLSPLPGNPQIVSPPGQGSQTG